MHVCPTTITAGPDIRTAAASHPAPADAAAAAAAMAVWIKIEFLHELCPCVSVYDTGIEHETGYEWPTHSPRHQPGESVPW